MLQESTAYEDLVAARLRIMQEQIDRARERSGRILQRVQLIAVTKYVDLPKVEALCRVGINHCGENRWQMAKPKVDANLPVVWHFIGPLQRNKVKYVVPKFDYVHSIDRLELAKDISAQAVATNRKIRILLQVNVSNEPQKSGVAPENALSLARECARLPALSTVGLMMIGMQVQDPETARNDFRLLRTLRDDMEARLGIELPELSMGMSDDFPVAVEEGATMVRIGRFLVLPEI